MNLLSLFAALVLLPGTQHSTMPAGMSHEEHLAQMEKDAALKRHGTAAMGFDQDRAVHHFRLSPTGGSIDVAILHAGDDTTRAQIRTHLQQIAGEFARGDYGTPAATHTETPPGVPAMQQRRAAIDFRYVETPEGARVVITTADPEALIAVHEFLRYQIVEHKTGDPTAVGAAEERRR